MIDYLRLVRLPNVFTALADILAGAWIARALLNAGGPFFTPELACVLGASAGLYLAGMAFNDIADRAEDAQFRPNRPLPSGRISVKGALLLAVVLLTGGVVLAGLAGRDALLRAGLLAMAVLQYDFRTKGHPFFGPATLGLCRFLNVQMGMSCVAGFGMLASQTAPPSSAWLGAAWTVPAAVGVYAAGITAFSAQEERGSQTLALLSGAVLCGGALIFAGVSSGPAAWIAIAPLLLVLQFLTFRLRRDGTPQNARALVRAGVMGICALDAGLVLGHAGLGSWPLAAGLLALLVPGLLLAKLLAQKEA